MFKRLLSYLIILSMLMMDAAPAMEEWSRDDDSRRENAAKRPITPSLHVLARGEREKEDVEHSDEEKSARSSSFNPNEFGGSWRGLPEDHKRMLKNMASLRREGEEGESLLEGGEDWDDDFYWLEKTEGNGGASAGALEESSWFGIFHWVKQSVSGLKGKKTSQTKNEEENGEKEEDNEREKEKEKKRDNGEEDGLLAEEDEAYEESEIWADSQIRDASERSFLRAERSNPGINGGWASLQDDEAGPSSDIQDRIRSILPEGVNLEDLPPSIRSLLISTVELEQGDETQQKTLQLFEYMYDYILQGKLTRKQLLVGGIGGALIAWGVTSGIAYLIIDEIISILSIKKSTYEIIFDSFFNNYAQWIIFTDAACRNIKTLVNLTAPSTVDFEYDKGKLEKTLMRTANALVYGCSSLVGFLLCYSLYEYLGGYENLFGNWSYASSFYSISEPVLSLLVFGTQSLTLIIDDTLFFGSRLTHPLKNFLWKLFSQRKQRADSDAERWREEIVKELRILERTFLRLSDKESLEKVQRVLGPLFIVEKGEERRTPALKIAEVLNTLKKLHTFYILYCPEDEEPAHKPLRAVFSTCVDWGLPIIAIWGRSVIFIYVISGVLIELGLGEGTANDALSIIFGGILASGIQMNYEAQAVHHVFNQVQRLPHHTKELFYQLYASCLNKPYLWISSSLLGASIYDDSPTPSLRGRSEEAAIQPLSIRSETENPEISSIKQKIVTAGLSLHNYFAGFWTATPFMLIGYYFATEGWGMGKQLVCLLPAFLSGFLGNAMAFQESEDDLKNFVKNLGLTTNANSGAQQRKKLITVVLQYREILEKINPSLLLHFKEISDGANVERQEYLKEPIFIGGLKSPLLNYRGLLSQAFHLERLLENKDLKTRRFLLYMQEFLIQNKITFNQALLSGIGGGLISTINGTINVFNTFHRLSQLDPFKIVTFIHDSIGINYFLPFSMLDMLSRTSKIISNFLTPSITDLQDKKDGKRKFVDGFAKVLYYGAASVPSLLPVGYFLNGSLPFEKHYGFQIFIIISYTAPCLFLNSLFFYGPRVCVYSERIFNNLFTHPIDHGFPSHAEEKRCQFLKEFKDLKWWLSRLRDDDEELHTIHHQVFSQPFLEAVATPEERERAQVTESLKTLWVLRQIHAQYQHEMVEPDPEHARKTFSKVVGWGLPLLATYGRSFIHWTIFYNLLEIIGVSDETTKIGLSVFMALIASLVQGSTEVEGTQKAVYELTLGNKVGEDTSQGWVRKTFRRLGKAQNYFMAALDTLPYIAVGMIATTDWSLWLSLATLIPAGIADMFKNVLKFNQSTGGAAQFVDQVAAKISYPTATQKRNQLVGLMRRYRKMFKKLHPDILMKLDEMLTSVTAEPQDLNSEDGNRSGEETREEEDHSNDDDDPGEKEEEKAKEKEMQKVSEYPSRSNASEEKRKKKKAQITSRSRDRKGWTLYTK